MVVCCRKTLHFHPSKERFALSEPLLFTFYLRLSERDRSGTTETASAKREDVKVMERIARPREAGARPNSSYENKHKLTFISFLELSYHAIS
jgi:hypothetical protein